MFVSSTPETIRKIVADATNPSTIAAAIAIRKFAIWRSGHTAREISIAEGIAETRLSQIVLNKTAPTDSERVALAKRLDLPVRDLFPLDPEEAMQRIAKTLPRQRDREVLAEFHIRALHERR